MGGNGELKTLKKNNIKEHYTEWNENMLRENVINNGFKPKSRRRRKTEVAVSILNLEKLEVNAYILYFCL